MVNEGVYDGDWQPSLLYPLPKTGKMDSKGKRKREKERRCRKKRKWGESFLLDLLPNCNKR